MTRLEEAFEGSTPLARKLAAAGPYPTDDALVVRARSLIATLTEGEQIETLNAHPRIGAEPGRLSPRSRLEQGGDALPELRELNEAYERRFGFRFVVFVNRRPKAVIVEVLKARLQRGRAEELATGLEAIVDIAEDRLTSRDHA